MSQNEIKLPTGSDRNKIEALAEKIQQASSVVNQLQIEIEALGQSQGNGDLTPCYRFTESSDYFQFSGAMTGEERWALRTKSFVEITFIAPSENELMYPTECNFINTDGFELYVIGENGTPRDSYLFGQLGLTNPKPGMMWVNRRAKAAGADNSIQDHQVTFFLDGVPFEKSVMMPRDGKKHTLRANFIGVPDVNGTTYRKNYVAMNHVQLYKNAALVSIQATTDTGMIDVTFNNPAKDHYSAAQVHVSGIEAEMKRVGYLYNFNPTKFVKL